MPERYLPKQLAKLQKRNEIAKFFIKNQCHSLTFKRTNSIFVAVFFTILNS